MVILCQKFKFFGGGSSLGAAWVNRDSNLSNESPAIGLISSNTTQPLLSSPDENLEWGNEDEIKPIALVASNLCLPKRGHLNLIQEGDISTKC